ncbi:hypothetical protein CNR22_09105 [Sphingobacteriaceae bacterium]|nr:hypothetical protein CNR22_09105 [Sphingobacteriaceae bacterium]
MNSRAYKIIFVLLSTCVLFIIGLQGYWIRNFYLQKKEEFNRSIYAALEELDTKFKERKDLQSLKMTYFIQNGDTIAKTPSHKITIITEKEDAIKTFHEQVASLKSSKIFNSSTGKSNSIEIKGTAINIQLGGTKATVKENLVSRTLGANASKDLTDSARILSLMNKMLNEIRVIDLDEESPDTVQALIKKTLSNKGIFLPFEFSMQNLAPGKKILAQSKGYAEQFKTFARDLSSKRVIYTGEFLFLQFPKLDDYLMAHMRGSLLLSLAFSLIIILVFFYVIKIILAQKKLSDIKNDFVNNITHELKTPIATISLALDAIGNPLIKNNEEKFKDYMRILKEENKKLNGHVERVLQTAVLDKGEIQLDKKQIAVKALLESVILDHRLQIIEQNAEITVDIHQDLKVWADERHLKTVFSNLLDNALKYSGERSELKISGKKESGKITIQFRDNGIGIDADKQRKIFEKFYRVQGGNLHDVKGFGLGLSYVKSIVEAHGGRVEVRSELGAGSEFVLVLTSS